MNLDAFSRTELVIGREGLERLAAARVALVGLGGVGSYAAEALARAGIGGFVLVDDDSIRETNLNRQVIALRSTLGRPKVEVERERILDINPEAEVEIHAERFGPESAERLLRPGLSYVVDAIDMVSAKIALVLRCEALGLPVVSCMGTGNKVDPTRLEVADLSETSICPLAKVMRKELRRRGVYSLTVVYSREEPIEAYVAGEEGPRAGRRSAPGSVSFVPSAAGLIAASVVARGIAGLGGRYRADRPRPRAE